MNPPAPLPIGLFFGSFNPLHNGHVAIADYLLEHGYCREIWFVVSPRNPCTCAHPVMPGFTRWRTM